MSGSAASPVADNALARYKQILRQVLENRPSGTRQRLATALGKNRSFISQIANPAYPTPIPAQHLLTIFEVCHFSPEDRRAFLGAYAVAHPRRHALVRDVPRTRVIKITVPDLGDARKNRVIEEMIVDFARRLARLPDDFSS